MRIDHKTRKACKKAAKTSLRKHYFIFVLMCLFASFIGAEFVNSNNLATARSDVMELFIRDYEPQIIATGKRAESLPGASIFTDMLRDLINDVKLSDEKADELFSGSAGTINPKV